MSMITNEILSALSHELYTAGAKKEMTKERYDAIMTVKNRLKGLTDPEGENISLSPLDEEIRMETLMDSYEYLNEMEAFYEKNGKWA